MSIITDAFDAEILRLLQNGGVGVIRTDTLYGIVGKASDQAAVERIYKAKTRSPNKSPIVLISSVDQLFDTYDAGVLARLDELWPGKNSVILPSQNAPEWITRGNQSVAYRMPKSASLRKLLDQTGPLVAPSANPEELAPASTIEMARRYFGDTVDFYVDGGEVHGDTPSRLYRLWPDKLERLR